MNYELYHGDCLDVMPTLEAGSIDAVITSPPYNVGKNYEANTGLVEYALLLNALVVESQRVIKPSGYLIINTNDRLTSTDYRPGINPVMPIIDQMCYRSGFVLFDRRIWIKDPAWMTNPWHGSSSKSVDEFEYIFIYQKVGVNPDLHQFTEFFRHVRSIKGVSNSDIDKLFGFNGMAGHWTTTATQAATPTVEQWQQLKTQLCFDCPQEIDQVVQRTNRVNRTKLTESEWSQWGSRSVWHIKSVQRNDDHPAKFPPEIPRRLIALYTWPGDAVCDPFTGSGTTGVVSAEMGRSFYGIERDSAYHVLAEKNISKAYRKAQGMPILGKATDTADLPLFA